jgi:hypothetical protein
MAEIKRNGIDLGTDAAFHIPEAEPNVCFELGLTKRELFAAMAMQGVLSSNADMSGSAIASYAVNIADELADALVTRLSSSSRHHQEVSGSTAESRAESVAPATEPTAVANPDWRVGLRVKPKFRPHPLFNKAEGLIRAVHASGFMGIHDVNGVLEIGLDWPFCFVVVQGENEWMTA